MAILQSSIVSGNLNVTGSLTVTGSTTFLSNVSGTTAQFTNLTASAFSASQPSVIDVSSSGTALRITQRGTGESFRVEDSTSPDSTPFVITNDGKVGIGTGSPSTKLDVKGSGEIVKLESTSATGNNYLRFRGPSANLGYVGYGSAANSHLNISNEVGDITLLTNNLERVRVDSSGNVGIGTTNPNSKLHIKDSNSHVLLESDSKNITIGMSGSTTDFNTATINLTSPPPTSGVTLLSLGVNVYGGRVFDLQSDNGSTDLILRSFDTPPSLTFHSDSSQLFRIQPDIDDAALKIFNSSNTAILRITQIGDIRMNSGRGIDFGLAPNAAGMTSELFDDYEEGTWTPAFSGSTGGGTFDYAGNQSGTYTKIGNMVYISGFVDISSITVAGSGNIRITGLPFNVANTLGNQFYINIAWTGVALSINNILGFAADAGSWIDVFRTTGAVTNSLSTAMTMAELGTGGFRFSGFYRVA